MFEWAAAIACHLSRQNLTKQRQESYRLFFGLHFKVANKPLTFSGFFCRDQDSILKQRGGFIWRTLRPTWACFRPDIFGYFISGHLHPALLMGLWLGLGNERGRTGDSRSQRIGHSRKSGVNVNLNSVSAGKLGNLGIALCDHADQRADGGDGCGDGWGESIGVGGHGGYLGLESVYAIDEMVDKAKGLDVVQEGHLGEAFTALDIALGFVQLAIDARHHAFDLAQQ